MGNDHQEIAIYSRKSKFTGKGESIGNQVGLCRTYVENLYGPEAAGRCRIFEDEGFSGGNLNRPAFQQMMALVRCRRIRAIVVYRLDRISRNISDFSGLMDELTRLDVAFISIREQFDTASPMGRAMMYILSVFSQLERETIGERIRDNMRELAKTGRWLGGNPPLGFRSEAVSKVSIDGKNRRSYRLTPVPREQEIPKLIFDLYTQWDSLTAVEAELLRRRIRTRQGKEFTRFAIKGILQNPVYIAADREAWEYFTSREAEVCFPEEAFDGTRGILAYNRTDQGKGTALLPVSEWIIALGAHPGLVPSDQWIRVQASLERNKSKAYRKPRRNEALLTGLLYCTCGSRMYPKLSGRETEAGEAGFSYLCKRKERSKGESCRCPNIPGNALDRMVLAQLRTLPVHPGTLLERLQRGPGPDQESQDPLWALREEAARTEKAMTSLTDILAMTDDPDTRAHLVKRLEEMGRAQNQVHEQMRAIQDQKTLQALSPREQGALGGELLCFSACVAAMAPEEKRAALASLIQKVIWDGKEAHVVLLGAEDPWGEGSK